MLFMGAFGFFFSQLLQLKNHILSF